jgi:phosphonate transport system substrate-binding protein
MRRLHASIALFAWLLAVGCHKQDTAAPAGPSLRVGLLPQIDPATEMRDQTPFAVYVESATSSSVDLVIGKTYASMVETLCAGGDDVAQLGGLTYLQAAKRCGAEPLVQRDVDKTFHSVFVTAADSPIQSLKDLAGHSFTFGSPDSGSGHLMPAFFMREAGVDPAVVKGAQYSGAHDKTLVAVATKKVDAGAMSETVFKKMIAEGKVDPKSVRVFYTSPPFVDNVWVARKDLDPKVKDAFTKALLALDGANPEQRAILDKFGAGKFAKASDAEYTALRAAAVDAGLLN